MKRILTGVVVVIAAGVFLALNLGASSTVQPGQYKIELENAFGLVRGADFKVAGVRAGQISRIALNQKTYHAELTVNIKQGQFGPMRSDAFCESRPQSLIGEYFVECQPGQHGKILPAGATIPVSRTQSTIPADLLQDIMRLPYRERLTLIVNELGAAVAARSDDLRTALRRAVPALTEVDNLLALLARDSGTLQNLTVNSDQLVTALADNNQQISRFIQIAGRTATDTATQQANLRGTLQQLPGFLEQLRPSMAQLGAATDANLPVLRNLYQGSGQLDRLLHDLPSFSNSALPALKSLGRASVTGRSAAIAATPTVRDLNRFARQSPELTQNLSIILRDLDDRNRAVEADPRSPTGRGFTGLEALLQWVFNQTLALNTFGPLGHLLDVDLFVDNQCSPYATPQTIAQNLQTSGASYRHCYAFLGPNQPGVTTPDPTNPGACVPDPGGAPPGRPGAGTSACKLQASPTGSSPDRGAAKNVSLTSTAAKAHSAAATARKAAGRRGGGRGRSRRTLGQILSGSLSHTLTPAQQAQAQAQGSASEAARQPGAQTQQLLNYLLAP